MIGLSPWKSSQVSSDSDWFFPRIGLEYIRFPQKAAGYVVAFPIYSILLSVGFPQIAAGYVAGFPI
jgi:hypothetical protein